MTTLDEDAENLKIAGDIRGPDLCVFLNTGSVAPSKQAVSEANGFRLWNQCKKVVPIQFIRESNCISPDGIPHLVGETFLMRKIDGDRLKVLKVLLKDCPSAIDKVDEFYRKFRREGDCDLSKLFRGDPSALSWKRIDGVDGSRLVADVQRIVAKNPQAFTCSVGNEMRYVKKIFDSRSFKRRWTTLCLKSSERNDVLPYLDGTTLDFLAFQLFVRCSRGQASNAVVVQDVLRSVFIGLGDLTEVGRQLELARSSDASEHERVSYGVTRETQEEGARDLRRQLDECAAKRFRLM